MTRVLISLLWILLALTVGVVVVPVAYLTRAVVIAWGTGWDLAAVHALRVLRGRP